VVDRTVQLMGKKITAGYVADRYEIPLAPDEDPATVLVGAAGPANPNNLKTPAGTPTDPAEPNASFTEDVPPEMKHDHAEFDRVFGELRDESVGLLKKRTKEIADALAAGRR